MIHSAYRFVEFTGICLIGNAVISGRCVVSKPITEATVNKATRLIFADHRLKLLALIECDRRRNIKPDKAQVAVLRQNLLDLALALGLEITREIIISVGRPIPCVAPVGLTPVSLTRLILLTAAVRLAPVEILGLVKAELKPGVATGLRKFFDDIAFERGRVDDIVLRNARTVHRKTVVMLRREDEILHAGVTRALHPILGVEHNRIEGFCQGAVILHGNFFAPLDPLAVGMTPGSSVPLAA